MDLTPSITKYIELRIGMLDKFIKKFEQNDEAEAVVEIARNSKHHKHGDVYLAEVNLHIGGVIIRAEHSNEDIRAAIDGVKDTLRNEIVKFKEKLPVKKDVVRKAKRGE